MPGAKHCSLKVAQIIRKISKAIINYQLQNSVTGHYIHFAVLTDIT